MQSETIQANLTQKFYPWHGGALGMCTDGATFGGGTATLKWHTTESSAGITIGTLTEAGSLTPTYNYGGGFISFEFSGSTSPDLVINFGLIEHPATVGKWNG